MSIPNELRYTRSHEWARTEGDTVVLLDTCFPVKIATGEAIRKYGCYLVGVDIEPVFNLLRTGQGFYAGPFSDDFLFALTGAILNTVRVIHRKQYRWQQG